MVEQCHIGMGHLGSVTLYSNMEANLNPKTFQNDSICSQTYVAHTTYIHQCIISYNRQITLVCDVGAERSLKASRLDQGTLLSLLELISVSSYCALCLLKF